MKNKVKTVELIKPISNFSGANMFPMKDTITVIIDSRAKVFKSCSVNKSSGSINSFGSFFLTSAFKISIISLSISLILNPLDNG